LKDYYQEQELTSSIVEQLLDAYYVERGWDPNGIPTREKLKDLDLGEFSI